jgi:XTP/dITP diphosphohydrolase
VKIIFASQNQHKIEEVSKILPSQIDVIGLHDLSFQGEIPETQNTIEGNALQKARFVYDKYAIPCFADDTGLFIEALDGEPGVYSARWSDGEEEFATNIEKALFKLEGEANRNAYFKTVIAFIDENNQEHLFEGRIDGRIINDLKGSGGFGYDPIFVPEGKTESFAEMSSAEKNKISHRGRAMAKFIAFFRPSTY